MAIPSKAEISALSNEEKLALIDALLESFEVPPLPMTESGELPSEDQRRILDERLLDLEIFPEDEITLAEARSRLLL